MISVALEARVQNVTGHTRCHDCGDNGWVVVQLRPCGPAMLHGKRRDPAEGAEIEEMGPCPYCEMGFHNEFPETSERTAIKPPWGPDGFWKGRDFTQLTPHEPKDARPLPMTEQRRLLAELRAAVAEICKPVERASAEPKEARPSPGAQAEPRSAPARRLHPDETGGLFG